MITNPLVEFLASYGPHVCAGNQYDELITESVCETGCKPINVKQPLLKKLNKYITGNSPKSIILTGTAGDGKTHTAKKLFSKINKGAIEWPSSKKIITVKYDNRRVRFIKDLSELNEKEKDRLYSVVKDSFFTKDNKNIFVICANDGNLIRFFRKRENENEKYKVRAEIERLLQNDLKKPKHGNFRLVNMSRIDNSDILNKIIDEVVNHEWWSKCSNCPIVSSKAKPCPIRTNLGLLADTETPSIRSRLIDMIRIAAIDGKHLSIRQLIILTVNIILGDGKENVDIPLLSCSSAKERAKNSEYRFTNPYANAFGDNLAKEDRKKFKVFDALNDFGVGHETNNYFDNSIVYGNSILPDNSIYGDRIFNAHRERYVSGDDEGSKEFLSSLVDQRRRIFFSAPTINENNTLKMHECPWNLTKFRNGSYYCGILSKNINVTAENRGNIYRTIVLGLNRIMSGYMTFSNSRLWIVRPSGIHHGRSIPLVIIRAGKESEEKVILNFKEPDRKTPYHKIEIDLGSGRDPIALSLRPSLIEGIIQVANGTLPSSLSSDCRLEIERFQLEVVSAVENLKDKQPNPWQLKMERGEFQLYPISALSNREEW